jgi:hypothetical protein
MATTGINKWEKYFKGQNLETFVKANSKATATKNKTDTGLTLAHGEPITVVGGTSYPPTGRLDILYKNKPYTFHIDCIEKPGRGGSAGKMNIDATKLIAQGDIEVVPVLQGQADVKCKCFYDARELYDAVIYGLDNEPSVPEAVTDQMIDYFKDNLRGDYNIVWQEGITPSQKTELGKYFGEVLIGYLGLNKVTGHTSISPWQQSNIKCFIVPDDPSFAGVDSAFLCHDGTIIPISSKFGKGAQASIFANIMPVAVKNKSTLPNGVLKDLAEISSKYANPAREGKKIVYEYGIKHILELKDISNPYDVYTNFKSGKIKPEYAHVATAVRTYVMNGGDGKESSAKELVNNLPKSLSSCLARGISDRLNADSASVTAAKSLIAGKNFYQANLNDGDWNRGKVFFNIRKAGDMKLTFTGSKAATTDIELKQGLLNYLLA